MGGRVLYLDIDGVLNPDDAYWIRGRGPQVLHRPQHRLFEHCGLLAQELASYPRIRMVLSSAWVPWYRGSLPTLARKLMPALQSRVVGATYHSRMNSNMFRQTPRWMQVWADVHRRRPESWLALDDDDEWPPWCVSHLVLTHPIFGINHPQVLVNLRRKLPKLAAGLPPR
ncbi:HAD domain-containing protein [Caballeronia glebae]|uniref:HAD domain-containing protein n=1 Tax=Caballeronia glebae TaxID=1777143 RepID=UPI0038BB8BD7